jgi:hypothetical protein
VLGSRPLPDPPRPPAAAFLSGRGLLLLLVPAAVSDADAGGSAGVVEGVEGCHLLLLGLAGAAGGGGGAACQVPQTSVSAAGCHSC